MRILVFAACALALLFPRTAAAQEQAFSDFRYLLEPHRVYSLLSLRHEPNMEADSGPGEYSLNFGQLSIGTPIALAEGTDLVIGASYGGRFYEFDNVAGARTDTDGESFHEISIHAGIEHFFNDSLYAEIHGLGGIFSDFSGSLDEEIFRAEGSAMLVYRINPGTALLLGVESSERFEDYTLIPLAGIRLLSSEGTLHIDLTAPRHLQVTYNMSPAFSIFGGYWISGDRFDVGIGPGEPEFDVQIHEQRLGGGFHYWLGEHVRLGVEGGAHVASELRFKIDDAGQFQGDLEPGPYVSASLGFSF